MSNPPYALGYATCDGFTEPIAKNSPNWRGSTFVDQGRKKNPASSQLCDVGLAGWIAADAPPERRLAKRVDAPSTPVYSEPVVMGVQGAYFGRRALPDHDPTAYRRTQRLVPPPPQQDRPEGKRAIPEPFGAPPRREGKAQGSAELLCRPAEVAAEPGMPRLSRPPGTTILRESDKELSYERAFGRKIRVDQDTYRGSGRAGDCSQSFAPPKRPEDDQMFYKTLKDSPAYSRFVNSLPPKPAVSPHQRHADELRRQAAAERSLEQQLVATLTFPGGGD